MVSIVWLAWRGRLLPDQADIQQSAPVLPSWMIFLLGWTPAVAAFMGLIGGLSGQFSSEELIHQVSALPASERDAALRAVRIAINTVTVLMAVIGWSLLHLGYARHYERLDHRYGSAIDFPGTKDAAGPHRRSWPADSCSAIDFPGTKDAGLTDYLYFAITIGSTFATSDVNVVSRRLRWTVATHSVLAFFYNAIVMAIAFKIITD